MPTGLKEKSALFKWSCQPIFHIRREKKKAKTTNMKDSQIVRFPVYVETDYDFRRWQMRLGQSHCSVPKAVAQRRFKAATILEARPYVADARREAYVTLESLG